MEVKTGKKSLFAGIKRLPDKQKIEPISSQTIPLLAPTDNAVVITKKDRDQTLIENRRKEESLLPLTIEKSSISLYSYEEMLKIAPIRVSNQSFEGNNSVNDPRMGVLNLNTPCQYCSKIDCPGHYGLIDFKNTPIYNPAFIRKVVSVIICVCNSCGGLLISEDLMEHYGIFKSGIDKRLDLLEAECKGGSCLNNKRSSAGGAIVPCRKNPIYLTKKEDLQDKGNIFYKLDKDDKKEYPTDIESINTILNHISVKDCYLLGFSTYHRQFNTETSLKYLDKVSPQTLEMYNLADHRMRPYAEILLVLDSLSELVLREKLGYPVGNHPRNMILRAVLVPPVIARPPEYSGGSMHYDQLTGLYIQIVKKADVASKGQSFELYYTIRQLIFDPDKKKVGMRDFLPIVERIQGKYALIRGLLMGKRNNYCARTVAGPDSSLKFGEISIPESWASSLTKRVKVTRFNKDNLEKLLEKGKIKYFINGKTGLKKFYDAKSGYKLRIGDSVERDLQNGDRIVINRQPTLHRQSMMGYNLVLKPQSTIGLHLSYTSPMNCDFDGDENNAWSPRDFEVEAETEILLNVKNNIMSSEQNRPIMGLVMNSITGVYLLTEDKTMIKDNLFKTLINLVSNKQALTTLHSRLLKYGVHPRSGKAVFSAVLPEDFFYDMKGVLIVEGILIKGRLKKSHVGASHRSIIQELYKNYGQQRTADFFTDSSWIVNRWLIERGFSVGILDMINLARDPNTGEEYDRNKRILDEELTAIYVKLEAWGEKLKDPIEEIFRMKKIDNLVNIAEGIGLRLAKEVLKGDNSIGIMTDQGAGTKGGIANIGQMMGSVGQQYYQGKRLKATLSNGRRLLPSFDLDDMNPEAHAFIAQSFFQGLTPENLFFLQAGGREGVLDTALKTAESGSIQRKMIKALENVIIGYDGSVRNTVGTLFSPLYNSGYDIGEMIAVDTSGSPNLSSFIDIKSIVSELNIKHGWVQKSLSESIKRVKTDETILQTEIQEKPKVKPASYNIYEKVDNSVRRDRITRYEKARIIGIRAMQLSNDATPLVDIEDEVDFVTIATKEYDTGLLQLYAIRKFVDGSVKILYPTLENI